MRSQTAADHEAAPVRLAPAGPRRPNPAPTCRLMPLGKSEWSQISATVASPFWPTYQGSSVRRSRCMIFPYREKMSSDYTGRTSGIQGRSLIHGRRMLRPGYASPAEAIKAPREKLLYSIAIYTGTGIQKPDYLATVDADPVSPTYSQVIHRLEMPGIGDELHHMGWNACSSCHGNSSMSRRYLLVPGVRSNNIHRRHRERSARAAPAQGDRRRRDQAQGEPLRPHTVHCLGSEIIISFLGDAQGGGAGRLSASEQGVRDRRALGNLDGRHAVRLRFLVPAPPQRDGQLRVGGPQHVHAGFRPRRGWPPEIWPPAAFLGFREARAGRDHVSGRGRAYPAGGQVPPQPRQHARLLRRGAQSPTSPFLEVRCGKWEWEKIIDVEQRAASRMADSRCPA